MARSRDEMEALWEKRTAVPLLVLSLVFLVAYAAPIINPDLPDALMVYFYWTNIFIWIAFVIDLVGRFILAEHKKPFLKRNIIMILAVALPFLRLLRLVTVLTMGISRFGGEMRNKVGFYVLGGALMVWFVTGLAVTQAERGVEGSNIQNVGDGWWWSLITLATVGYGDRFPVTPEGRWVGVAIIVTGMAVLGTISAILASVLLDPSGKRDDEILEDTVQANATIHDLLAEVKALRAEVRALSNATTTKPKTPVIAKKIPAKKPVSKK